MDWMAGECGSIPSRCNNLHSGTFDHYASYSIGVGANFLPRQRGRDEKLITHFHLMPRLRMSGL